MFESLHETKVPCSLMKVLILGAGVIGVTTAYEPTNDGYQVTVIDRQSKPALETSFGNAGLIYIYLSDESFKEGMLVN